MFFIAGDDDCGQNHGDRKRKRRVGKKKNTKKEGKTSLYILSF